MRAKITIKNGLRDKSGLLMGDADKNTGKIRINLSHKKHKDKKELASTIKHELMHIKHPKMWEKTVYKKTCKKRITPSERVRLLAKLKK